MSWEYEGYARTMRADFALASHYSIAPAAGLDVAKHRRVDEWLRRVLARDSFKRAIADTPGAM